MHIGTFTPPPPKKRVFSLRGRVAFGEELLNSLHISMLLLTTKVLYKSTKGQRFEISFHNDPKAPLTEHTVTRENNQVPVLKDRMKKLITTSPTK